MACLVLDLHDMVAVFGRGTVIVGLLAFAIGSSTAALAQPAPPLPISPAPPQPQAQTDFWFGRPRGSIGVRTGWLFSRAGSDLFDFVAKTLTVDKSDFSAPPIAAEVGIQIGPRTEVLVGFEFAQSSKTSEYRHFVDNNRLPINQTTQFRQMNLTGGLKFALAAPGREISRLAWIPRAMVPYVGAGAGFVWYRFEQNGDFIDFKDSSVFSDFLGTRGWGPSAHVFGGVDINVWRRMYVVVDARYLWSHSDVGGDFVAFQPIDLAGARLTAGVKYAF